MRIFPMTERDVRDGLQVDQWFLFLIGSMCTTLPAFLLMVIFGALTTRYKFAKSDNPSKIDGVFCVMAGLVGGILIWIIAALAFSITA